MTINDPPIDYGSVCSGIEAASVAWEPLGMRPAWFAEIASFPSAVLAHHHPRVPNLGDMTRIAEQVRGGAVLAPDVLVGGTPCQAFSIAGMRNGLSDPRGALTLKYTELANAIDHVRTRQNKVPAVVVWENVPGVLTDRANAFGHFLGALAGERRELQPPGSRWTDAGCVYGPQRAIAWRILDAQHFGLAQRRRRVFVVASARSDFDPAEVLFEREGVRRDSAPSRETVEDVAAAASPGFVRTSHPVGATGQAPSSGVTLCFGGGNTSGPIDPAACLTARGHKCDFSVETFAVQAMCGSITHPLTCAHGVTEDGNGRGTPVVAVAGNRALRSADVHSVAGNLSHALNAANGGKGCSEDGTGRGVPIVAFTYHVEGRELHFGEAPTTVAFAENSRGEVRLEGGDGRIAGALSGGGGKAGQGYPVVASVSLRGSTQGLDAALRGDLANALRDSCAGSDKSFSMCGDLQAHLALTPAGNTEGLLSDRLIWRVRRLMPLECERLQGFPDNYTLVSYRGGPSADGPRYQAIGNSMAVPCMGWIGQRLVRAIRRSATAVAG